MEEDGCISDRPSKITEPVVGKINPHINRHKVVLPIPEAPRIDRDPPYRKLKVISFKINGKSFLLWKEKLT
jgi:hypothetical protein